LKAFQKVETELEKLKGALSSLEAQLGDPAVYANKDQFLKLDSEYKALSPKLEAKNKEYEKLFEEVIQLEEKIR
jgi:ATP-binding cassette subfamily F protein 3